MFFLPASVRVEQLMVVIHGQARHMSPFKLWLSRRGFGQKPSRLFPLPRPPIQLATILLVVDLVGDFD
jgi:hypothetical protein